jgi:hypothetical protein
MAKELMDDEPWSLIEPLSNRYEPLLSAPNKGTSSTFRACPQSNAA